MVRVADLERSLAFYVGKLGMRLLRRHDFPEGQFTLAFVGYGTEQATSVIELTHNWGTHEYTVGTGFGHFAISVADVSATTRALEEAGVKVVRPAGPLKGASDVWIAFVEDPDGYRIELIQRVAARPQS